MKALVHDRYGPPEALELVEVDTPDPAAGSVLVRVRAISLNPADWYGTVGVPYVGRPAVGLRKPRRRVVGTDFAGTVEAVGEDVNDLRPGDEVFGAETGAFAEYVCAGKAVVLKPAALTFEQAAAVPVAALTALQGLRDQGAIQAGQDVLVNGASGGVGTFAVQIAKEFGARVTGVCSTRNVELVRSIGADYVVDYSREDFTRGDTNYDLVLDVAGSRPWSECKRVLKPHATVVLVGGQKGGRLLGPLSHVASFRLAAIGSGRKVVFFIARLDRSDLLALNELLESGAVTPVVDRTYAMSEAREAFRYLGEGHARGKVVLTVP